MQSSKPKDISLGHLRKVLRPVITRFTDVLNFHFCCLIYRDQRYDDYVPKGISKTAKLMQVQMYHNIFDQTDQISVLNFLSTFKTTFNSIGVSERAIMRLLPTLLATRQRRSSTVKPAFATCRTNRYNTPFIRNVASSITYWLRFTNDYLISKAANDITNCTQSRNKTSGSYAQTLWDNSLRSSTVYYEAILKEVFIEGLFESIQLSMRHYSASKKSS